MAEVQAALPKFDARHNELEEKVAALDAPDEEEKKDLEGIEPTDVSHLKGKKGVPDFWLKIFKSHSFIK